MMANWSKAQIGPASNCVRTVSETARGKRMHPTTCFLDGLKNGQAPVATSKTLGHVVVRVELVEGGFGVGLVAVVAEQNPVDS